MCAWCPVGPTRPPQEITAGNGGCQEERSRRTLCQSGGATADDIQTGLGLLFQVARRTPDRHLVVDLGHIRLAVGLGLLATCEKRVGLVGPCRAAGNPIGLL